MSDPNIADMFRALERQLQVALDKSRAAFRHRGIKGSLVEDEIRTFLSEHLPRSSNVGTGEVIDITGTRSGQLDVIICGEDQPFRFETNEAGLYIVEGVTAVGEVKSVLTTGELAKAIKSGSQFKQLRVLHDKTDYFEAKESDYKRFHNCPPYFVVAFDCEVVKETLLERLSLMPLASSPRPHGVDLSPIDAVFILGKGVAINFGDGEGNLRFKYHNGTYVTGWCWWDTDCVLANLLMWLHAVMPRVHRPISPSPPYMLMGQTIGQATSFIGGNARNSRQS
ncbi:DUF6602 domain-containing protein [Microbispora hainanensis]|uniref:DUF6602 domain-containing protein n=1 Tax=Microbispora hainanensis TaxID=568844 RepID=UPI0033E17051